MPELVEDQGDRPQNRLITPVGQEPLCTMPVFATLRLTTQVYAHPGEVLLLGALTPRGDDGEAVSEKRVLMFMRLFR